MPMAEEDGYSPGWGDRSFAAAVSHQRRPFYVGDGEEDFTDDLGMADVIALEADVAPSALCPVADIPWDFYRTL